MEEICKACAASRQAPGHLAAAPHRGILPRQESDPARTRVQYETARAYAVWLLSPKVLKDDHDALTLIAEMRRLSALFDRQHKETARVCREVTAEARRATRAALKRKPARRHTPRNRKPS